MIAYHCILTAVPVSVFLCYHHFVRNGTLRIYLILLLKFYLMWFYIAPILRIFSSYLKYLLKRGFSN
jgi:hypothetical protein